MGGDVGSTEECSRSGSTAEIVGWEAILGVNGVGNVSQFGVQRSGFRPAFEICSGNVQLDL